jgi:hypothetical protein
LAPQPSLGLGLLLKIQLNFLEASQQFSFLQGRVVSPTPNPIPEDQASVFISPRGRVATHFSRLLRHAWLRWDYSYSSCLKWQHSDWIRSGLRFPIAAGIFLFATISRPLWGPANLLSNRYLEQGGPERETDLSRPTSVQIKNVSKYTSTPPCVCMTLCWVKLSYLKKSRDSLVGIALVYGLDVWGF